MSWQDPFKKGVALFQAGKYVEALSYLDKVQFIDSATDGFIIEIHHQAIEFEKGQYVLYDSRAAVYDKLNKPKEALRDAKTVITLAPDRWQGYFRSARILLKARRPEAAIIMIEHACERVAPNDTKRRGELDCLKAEALRLHQPPRPSASTPSPRKSVQLPVELWAEVFREVVSFDHTRVLVLSRVCKHWRDITLNIAALWDTLVLTRHHPAAKVQTWMKRSKGLIRRLHITEAVANDFDLPPLLKQMSWEALRSLKLDDGAIDLMVHVPIIQFSTLHILELRIRNSHNQEMFSLLECTGTALHSLTVQGIGSIFVPLSPQWTSLVSIALRHVILQSLDAFLYLLRSNPTLDCVILEGVQFVLGSRPLDTHSPEIHLPVLTRLEIVGILPVAIYSDTIFPSLQTLVIKNIRSIEDDLFIARQMNLLKELRIQRCGVPNSLYPFLRGLSSLETLQVSDIAGAAESITEVLTTVPGGVTVCPSLTHLDFSGCHDLQSGPLIRLIKSRSPANCKETLPAGDAGANASEVPRVARVSSLNIDRCPLIDVETLPWLRSKIPLVSCVYATKKQASWRR